MTAGGCSGGSTETSSVGLVCGAGCCSTGFSSTTGGGGGGGGGGGADCASREAFVLLLRGAGAADGSLGSTGLRGFLVFFSSTVPGSLGFGFGPGFLRMVPAAVNRGVEVVEAVEAGVGVLGFAATPTLLLRTRIVEVFPLFCSGE